MTTRALDPQDVRQAQQAQGLLQRGDAAGAKRLTGALVRKGVRHPDVLTLHGIACRRAGALDEAREAMELAVEAAPDRAALWNNYANLLDDMGEAEAAIDAYRRAVALQPDYAEAWMNLGLAAASAGRVDEAREALSRATAIAPTMAAAWGALGHAELAGGRPDEAAAALRRALALQPSLASARHNLGSALRAMDEPKAALEAIDPLARSGQAPIETLVSRAHLLGDLGRLDEAVDAYRNALARDPGQIDAHATLARLLPQIGRADDALASYDEALARMPGSEALWRSALAAAQDLERGDALLRWSGEAQRRFPGDPGFVLAQSHAIGLAGDAAGAAALADTLDAGDPTVATHLAYWRLRAGDPAGAEAPALHAATVAPWAQSAWAYLTVIWRLLGDPREDWLADYDRLVMPIDLPFEAGELDRLADWLEAQHVTREAPGDQSLRAGTQTRGNLFDRRAEPVRRLRVMIRDAVTRRLLALPMDEDHPFLGRMMGGIAFAGSWSVRLRASGHHVGHIHHRGWLSSALHVRVPDEVAADNGEPPAGALTFGVPDTALGLDLAPRRIERPVPGRLVVFPSYFWHGTVPFDSMAPRLTVAFDALPS